MTKKAGNPGENFATIFIMNCLSVILLHDWQLEGVHHGW